jgi:hypothetical protein
MGKYMVKLLFKLVLVLSILSSLPSCSLSPDAMALLEKSVNSYERAVRWGEFTRAKSFHKNEPILSDLERRRLKFYRVSGYASRPQSTPDKYNSFLVAEIKYYRNDRPVIKAIIVKQHWKRDKNSEVWYLESPFPKFR